MLNMMMMMMMMTSLFSKKTSPRYSTHEVVDTLTPCPQTEHTAQTLIEESFITSPHWRVRSKSFKCSYTFSKFIQSPVSHRMKKVPFFGIDQPSALKQSTGPPVQLTEFLRRIRKTHFKQIYFFLYLVSA